MKNVLLICGAGASSGFMASAIRKAAKKRGIEISISAKSESQLSVYIDQTDILLIGPHLSYMEKDLIDQTKSYNINVSVIPQLIYGTLDGNKALDLILSLDGKGA